MASRLSVVVRTKDRPIFLARAMASLARQTRQGFETVVVNDGGDADLVTAALEAFPPSRLTRIDHAASSGRSRAFNAGLRAASGSLIACLDDDDTYEPQFVAEMLDFFDTAFAEDPRLSGVLCRCETLYEDFHQTRLTTLAAFEDCFETTRRNRDTNQNWSKHFISPFLYYMGEQGISTLQTVFRKAGLEQVGGFDERRELMEDKGAYFPLSKLGPVAVLHQYLANYHIRNVRNLEPASNVVYNAAQPWERESHRYFVSDYYGGDAARPSDLLFPLLRDQTLYLRRKLNRDASEGREALSAQLDRIEQKLDRLNGLLDRLSLGPLWRPLARGARGLWSSGRARSLALAAALVVLVGLVGVTTIGRG